MDPGLFAVFSGSLFHFGVGPRRLSRLIAREFWPGGSSGAHLALTKAWQRAHRPCRLCTGRFVALIELLRVRPLK